jgi:acetylornithine/succinyldiaminopimelate/putrescine aminotransferase/predicted amino acid dehydrogenase
MEKESTTVQEFTYKPKLGELLSFLQLDKVYKKAKGSYLYCDEMITDANSTGKVIDFVCGYGSALLGHNHPALKELAIELIENDIPVHSQLSTKLKVNELASYLGGKMEKETGHKYQTILANSGAEVVEAAIKHAGLAFSARKNEIINEVARSLHKISNNFNKSKREKLSFQGKEYRDIIKFKEEVYMTVNDAFSSSKPILLAAEGAFHGKTLAALQVTFNENFKPGLKDWTTPFNTAYFKKDGTNIEEILTKSIVLISYPQLDYNDEIQLKQQTFCNAIAAIVEPIQGEGGINDLQLSLSSIKKDTSHYGIPLIFDEIQSGCYRTGAFLASTRSKVLADYYLLSKSFGGAMAKNSALLIRKENYRDEFDVIHTSTFAEDEISASISIKSLKLSEDLSKEIPRIELNIKKSFKTITEKYPKVIKEYRGLGLMWGLELRDLNYSDNCSFQMISRSGYFGYLAASYLLNQWSVRIAPTLSNSFTLRILPSVVTSSEDVMLLEKALLALCEIIDARDFYKLIEHLLPESNQELRDLVVFPQTEVVRESNEKLENIGFITHCISEQGLKDADPSLTILSDEAVAELNKKVMPFSYPILLNSQVITSSNGKQVNAHYVGMCLTARNISEKLNSDNNEKLIDQVNDAVDFAQHELNCSLVGLGQYTSIITKNGTLVNNPNVAITTGNSYTVAIGVKAILRELKLTPKNTKDNNTTLGVIGAAGNISAAYVKILLLHFPKVLLKGGEGVNSTAKINKFVNELYRYVINTILNEDLEQTKKLIHHQIIKVFSSTDVFSKIKEQKEKLNNRSTFLLLEKELGNENPFIITHNLNDFTNCQATIVATSSATPFLKSSHFSPNAIVYDVSIPVSCTQELINNAKNIKVLLGGIVALPNNEKIDIKGFPLDGGELFACMAETLLIGLEGIKGNYSYGSLNINQIAEIDEIAEANGFGLKMSRSIKHYKTI